MSFRAGTTSGPSGGIRAGTDTWNSIIPGRTTSGAVTESAGDSAAGAEKNNPTNVLLQFGIDPTTLRTTSDSLGSQLTGSSVAGDLWFLPTVYNDGGTNQSIIWELDNNNNATGRIANMAGSGNATNLPYRYWNGSTLLSSTFSTQGSAVTRIASGAVTESGGDTTSGAANVKVSGSGSGTEAGTDTAAGTSSVTTRASGTGIEGGTDTATGTAAATATLTGITQEPSDSSVGSAKVAVTMSGGPAESGPDTASGIATPSHVASGAATDQGPDLAAGVERANVITSGASTESGADIASGYAAHASASSGTAVEGAPDTAQGIAHAVATAVGDTNEDQGDSASGFGNAHSTAAGLAQEGGTDKPIGHVSVGVITGGDTVEDQSDSASGEAISALAGAYSIDPRFLVSRSIDGRTPRFGIKYVDEKVVLTFDFSGDLVDEEKLVGPFTLSARVSAGDDENILMLFNGDPAFDLDRQHVLQPVQGGEADCDYYFKVTVPTSNPSKVLVLSGLLQVRNP